LRAARNFTVSKISLNQIDEGSAGFASVRRWQRMRENTRLDFVTPRCIAEYGTLEPVEHDQYRTQGIVGHIAGTAGPAHESQMQEAADAATLVMQAQRESPMQISDHEHRFGRDKVSVRRDQYFREFFNQCGPLCDSAMLHVTVNSLCRANHGFRNPIRGFKGPSRNCKAYCKGSAVISSCFVVIGASMG
jgi:hypothetical protein